MNAAGTFGSHRVVDMVLVDGGPILQPMGYMKSCM